MARNQKKTPLTKAETDLYDEQFLDVRWRLNNLYFILDKEGKRRKFVMNWAQEQLFDDMHFQNVILKARQLGFTTFIQLLMLDACIFNFNVRAGTIAHTRGDAQVIFRDKVKYPYTQLDEGLQAAVPALRSNATELLLANNSSIRVGTSLRSGTLQYLHVSEYGKLCSKFPEKAREVRTGALNTVQAGQLVFVESTAEGQEGHFYELCQDAQGKKRRHTHLTPLDFKFSFFPWWRNPEYALANANVTVPDHFARYFDKLAGQGIPTAAAQQAWYVKKAEVQLADMKREYPSTPEEAFEAAVEGAYYADQIAEAELAGRVGVFPADPAYLVHSAWDIGRHDYTSIWFFQIIGSRLRIVGYYSLAGHGLPVHAAEIERLRAQNNWTWGTHIWPHDGRVVEWGSDNSRIEQGVSHNLDIIIATEQSLEDGINITRSVFKLFDFDEGPTALGRRAIANYHKLWLEDRGMWSDLPHHNWASHGADALRYLAVSYHRIDKVLVPQAIKAKPEPLFKPLQELTYDEYFQISEGDGKRERL
jgi:hypothetical protein